MENKGTIAMIILAIIYILAYIYVGIAYISVMMVDITLSGISSLQLADSIAIVLYFTVGLCLCFVSIVGTIFTLWCNYA